MTQKRKSRGLREYIETIRCSCGHEITVTTTGYKLERAQVKYRQKKPCHLCAEVNTMSSGLIG